jgi:hypothetical protein
MRAPHRDHIQTSRPAPNWSTPVFVLDPGFGPPYSKVEFGLKWPYPPPRLTQGETLSPEKIFNRAEGAMKNDPKFLGTVPK